MEKKEYICDLQIHSKYARACSKNISIENLEKYARIKGIDLLGVGDFQHPERRKEIDEKLVEDDNEGEAMKLDAAVGRELADGAMLTASLLISASEPPTKYFASAALCGIVTSESIVTMQPRQVLRSAPEALFVHAVWRNSSQLGSTGLAMQQPCTRWRTSVESRRERSWRKVLGAWAYSAR